MLRGRALVTLAAAALVLAGPAAAHEDPASDQLLSQVTFLPPDDGIPRGYARQLDTVVRDAKARGYAIRVAVIGTRYDLGSVRALWGKPKAYARFLGGELSLDYQGSLLVAMPNGLAVSRRGQVQPREQAIVDRIAAPGSDGAALASAATRAVVRLATAAGIVLPHSEPSGGGSTSRNRDRLTIAAATVLAVAFLVVARRRRATPHGAA